MRMIVVMMIMVMTGCSVHIRSDAKLPSTPSELREFVAEYSAELEGLEAELVEATKSRDAIADAAKLADGYFAQSEYAAKLSNANRRVEFAAKSVTWSKQSLARAKAKLDEIEKAEVVK